MGNKSAVSTPLILLQQLSRSLVKHFEAACEQAVSETQRVLTKLEKQRQKIEKRLREAEVAFEAAIVAGKPKAQARARETSEALQATLDAVLDRQLQTHTYLLQLQRDVQAGLGLAAGIVKVENEAGKAVDALTSRAPRAATAAQPKAAGKPRAAAAASKSPKSVAPGAAEKAVQSPVGAAKPRARRPAGAPAKQAAPAARATGTPAAS